MLNIQIMHKHELQTLLFIKSKLTQKRGNSNRIITMSDLHMQSRIENQEQKKHGKISTVKKSD